MKEHLWLIQTNKGDFFMSAYGNWTLEEAAKKVRTAFDIVKLTITAMIPRKRATGPSEMMCTIYEQKGTTNPLGFEFIASKKMWDACGMSALYDAELIRLENEG